MDWIENLPTECPPKEAFDPTGRKLFRLCKENPACEEDFKSHRAIYPEREFQKSECICCSLSVMDSIDGAKHLLKMPVHRGKLIGELALVSSDGLILKTSGPGHYSWWRTKQFKLESVKIIS